MTSQEQQVPSIPNIHVPGSTSPLKESQTSSPTITILYFSSARTSFSPPLSQEILALPIVPFALGDLAGILVQRHERNKELGGILARSVWSVNEVVVEREKEIETPLMGGEVVACIPPVSGG
ncbi:hypothetical protein BT69DRAFT_1264374 [Atractiella rhizophila]|nr:hypothetical protein BT69DRAFT_1264374 [Atractiella rhizophila]